MIYLRTRRIEAGCRTSCFGGCDPGSRGVRADERRGIFRREDQQAGNPTAVTPRFFTARS
ncbi:hypothetical protein [Methanoculleus horonobensis]|uniref:hypothetical protein n=1 Tax=Methanoculleus horonobensis TaxID=528314 RepID=UPI0012900640|nr:hypothetical protein [Methanoculleus horonobensis]